MRELHLYKLKVDCISDSTTNVERALKMESVMSSFRLFIDKNTGNVELDILQLNRCKATSIRAEQLNPKSNGLFQETKTNFRTRNFFSG